MAEECVRGLLATTQGHKVEILAAVDADADTAMRLEALGCIVDYCDEYRGNSTAWNVALAGSKGDPIVFAADDLVWEPGWLEAALGELEQFDGGWGLVGFNDGHWGAELSTHYLMSRRFIIEILGGVVAWDFYRHSFNDLEVNERAKRAGRYRWCEQAHVRHRHWLFGDRAKDDTDTRTLASHAEAERIYSERAAKGFPNDFAPVIE